MNQQNKLKIMMRNGSRMIKVDKLKLIEKIKENKENHIVEYDKAVKAFKIEALKQLEKLKKMAEKGDMKIELKLTTPVDNQKNYDKILEMFTWEIADEVELEQNEFTEYVQDETHFAISAKLSNQAYFSNLG